MAEPTPQPPETDIGHSNVTLNRVTVRTATEDEYTAHIANCSARILAISLAMLTDIDMVTIGTEGVVFHTTEYGGGTYLINVSVQLRRKDVPEEVGE